MSEVPHAIPEPEGGGASQECRRVDLPRISPQLGHANGRLLEPVGSRGRPSTDKISSLPHARAGGGASRERGGVDQPGISPSQILPLSSEYGTYKTVKARFWPWLSGKSPEDL